MKRHWHVLKGNLRCETAHNLIFFDTETRAVVQPDGSERDYLTFGWVCIVRRTGEGSFGPPEWLRFRTVSGFWKIINRVARPKKRWFLFCHNTSYDLPVLDIFGRSARHGWVVESAVIEAPPTIITLKRSHCTLTWVDTLNWWRMPLAKLGERLGLAKLPMPEPGASKLEWDTYCKRDVDVLRVTVCRWLDFLIKHDLGGFASTLAGQAFRTFRHRFMKHEIVIDCDDRALAVSREAYHGGRVECFKLGRQEGPIYAYDVNSMFAAVMRRRMYPTRLVGYYGRQSIDRWPRLVTDYSVVARCRLQARAPCYPVHTRNGLCFPTGDFEAALCTPEIRLALKRGELLDMRDIAVYEHKPIFTAYVNFMWNKRAESQTANDTVEDWMFKHLLTNLYGKFGQTGLVYETQDHIADTRCMKYQIIDADSGKVYKCRQLGGLLQVMSSQGEARDSFPAISAHVTSYARVLLWELANHAGLEYLLYTDTDCLYVTEPGTHGLKRFIDPKALGKLKLVGMWPWMQIHGLKDYELPNHVVRKGVRANAEQIGPNTFRQTQWSSLKGLVGLGDVTAPTRKQVVKVLARTYKKGRAP